jgi:hypothetical protein
LLDVHICPFTRALDALRALGHDVHPMGNGDGVYKVK